MLSNFELFQFCIFFVSFKNLHLFCLLQKFFFKTWDILKFSVFKLLKFFASHPASFLHLFDINFYFSNLFCFSKFVCISNLVFQPCSQPQHGISKTKSYNVILLAIYRTILDPNSLQSMIKRCGWDSRQFLYPVFGV